MFIFDEVCFFLVDLMTFMFFKVTDTIVEEDDERFHLERTLDEIEDEL